MPVESVAGGVDWNSIQSLKNELPKNVTYKWLDSSKGKEYVKKMNAAIKQGEVFCAKNEGMTPEQLVEKKGIVKDVKWLQTNSEKLQKAVKDGVDGLKGLKWLWVKIKSFLGFGVTVKTFDKKMKARYQNIVDQIKLGYKSKGKPKEKAEDQTESAMESFADLVARGEGEPRKIEGPGVEEQAEGISSGEVGNKVGRAVGRACTSLYGLGAGAVRLSVGVVQGLLSTVKGEPGAPASPQPAPSAEGASAPPHAAGQAAAAQQQPKPAAPEPKPVTPQPQPVAQQQPKPATPKPATPQPQPAAPAQPQPAASAVRASTPPAAAGAAATPKTKLTEMQTAVRDLLPNKGTTDELEALKALQPQGELQDTSDNRDKLRNRIIGARSFLRKAGNKPFTASNIREYVLKTSKTKQARNISTVESEGKKPATKKALGLQ